MLNNASILITGGTGSFGNEFVDLTLKKYNPKKIVIYSRDEMKQWQMAARFPKETRLHFFIGDVRDQERLNHALDGIDYVIHAAAMKIVPSAEYNPSECIKTNIIGAMNVINACLDKGVKRCVALSTDKASSPVNLYGATKLCSEKLFVASNLYKGQNITRFSIIRYGNIMGSRGSVIPAFIEQAKLGSINITNEKMTRFMTTLESAISLVWHALGDMKGGEIYVKKCPSIKLIDIAKAVAQESEVRITGIRSGEKLHEQMIGIDDTRYTYEYINYYKIIPQILNYDCSLEYCTNGTRVPEGFTYTSNNNNEWISIEMLRKWVSKYKNNAYF